MAKKELVDLSYKYLVHETARAYLIDFDLPENVWIPKDACELDEKNNIITMSAGLAEEKGLEDNAI